jgi:membrane protein implicated in regulation of membrane protease activity
MESLKENTALYKSLAMTFMLMMLLAAEIVPSLNVFLELHPLPSDEFKMQLLGLLVFDVVSTYFYSKTLRRIFAVKPSKKIRAGNNTRQPTNIELSQKKEQ